MAEPPRSSSSTTDEGHASGSVWREFDALGSLRASAYVGTAGMAAIFAYSTLHYPNRILAYTLSGGALSSMVGFCFFSLRNVCRTTLGRSRVPEYIPRTEMPLIRVVRDPLTHMPVLEVAPEPDAIYRPDYVATGVAAALTGFTFATITRSPRYAFGASVVFSALALSGHSVYTVFRRWQRRNIIAVNKNVAVIQAARDGVITADEQEHMLSATPLLHRWRDSVSSRWPDWLPLRPLTTSEYAKIKSEESLSVDQQLMKEIVAERAAAKQQQQQSPTRPTSSS